MRKIWSRLATLVLILVVSISFSACSLFTTDLDKKYSAEIMVATAGNGDVSISRQELYYGYLQWGYQYANYYSSTEKLLEEVATTLLNNKILEKESIKKFGNLRETEEALALKRAYNSLNETLRSDLNKTLNIEEKKDTTAEKDETDDVDKKYTPSIYVNWENGERVFALNMEQYHENVEDGVLLLSEYEYYVPSVPGLASESQVRQAISKIVRNLQSLEKGFTKLKTPARDYLMPGSEYFTHLSKAERAVLNREIERMVVSNKTSILTDRIGVAYNLGFFTLDDKNDAMIAWDAYLTRGRNFDAWCDLINGIGNQTNAPKYFGCGRKSAKIIADKTVEIYKKRVEAAINQQKNFSVSDFEATIMDSNSGGLKDVYYIPQEVANNLFTVSHILIKYSDSEGKELSTDEKLPTAEDIAKDVRIDYDGDKDNETKIQEEIENRIETMLHSKATSNGKTALEIYKEVASALKDIDDLDAKYKKFREFIQKYNADPGMQNLDQLDDNSKPKYEYLMSANNDNNNMVAEFNEGSLELFDKGKGQRGNIKMVWTTYGAHIIMYTRKVGEFVYTGFTGTEENSIETLKCMDYPDILFTTLTSYGDRTMFDTLVNENFTPNSSNYLGYILEDYKTGYGEITIYDNELKNFL